MIVRRLLQIAVLFFAGLTYTWAGVPSNEQVPARKSQNARTEAQQEVCQHGGTSFKCPKGFKIKSTPEDSFLYLHHEKYDLGMFVAGVTTPGDMEALRDNLAKAAVQKLLPKETRAFEWKAVEAPSKVSKFETGSGGVQGFNGRVRLFVKHRLIAVGGKSFIVGYVFEMGEGREARELFAAGLGGDSMPACNASVEVIYSLTGEKVDVDDPPCSFSIIAPVNR